MLHVYYYMYNCCSCNKCISVRPGSESGTRARIVWPIQSNAKFYPHVPLHHDLGSGRESQAEI